jgi:hypothetical protein
MQTCGLELYQICARRNTSSRQLHINSLRRVQAGATGRSKEVLAAQDTTRSPDVSCTPSKADPAPWQSTGLEKRLNAVTSENDGKPTQLIFNLYNRGYGWGEEIVPHLTVERREVVRKERQEWQV